MSLTYYIRLKSVPAKGANHARTFEGKTVAANWGKLTATAKQLGIKSLQDFVGVQPDASTKQTEKWFLPQDGLICIRKLISTVSSNSKAFEHTRNLIRDLQGYENILSAAESRGSRFHFSPDMESDVSQS